VHVFEILVENLYLEKLYRHDNKHVNLGLVREMAGGFVVDCTNQYVAFE